MSLWEDDFFRSPFENDPFFTRPLGASLFGGFQQRPPPRMETFYGEQPPSAGYERSDFGRAAGGRTQSSSPHHYRPSSGSQAGASTQAHPRNIASSRTAIQYVNGQMMRVTETIDSQGNRTVVMDGPDGSHHVTVNGVQVQNVR